MEIILLSSEQLKALIDERLKEAFQKFLPVKETPKENTLLTRKATAKHFNISLPTLNEWTKAGKLTSYRIAGSVRYKKDEVEKALSKIKYIPP